MFMPTQLVSASPCAIRSTSGGAGPAIPVRLQTDKASSNTDFAILIQAIRNLSIRQSGNGSAPHMEQLLRFLCRVRSDKRIRGRPCNLLGICEKVVSRVMAGGDAGPHPDYVQTRRNDLPRLRSRTPSHVSGRQPAMCVADTDGCSWRLPRHECTAIFH